MNLKLLPMIVSAVSTLLLAPGSKGAEPHTLKQGEVALPRLHNQRLPVVAMLVYPGMTLLDTMGPQAALSTSCKIHLVWKDLNPLVTDSGVMITPDTTLENCPKDLDVFFVGGGSPEVMQDAEVMAFVADRGGKAKYVTSVCNGSIVLGAAGLLDGYRAASHWAVIDALPLFGATPVRERVVTDRNRITGGGVTAGIDFGLVLISKLIDEKTAKLTQLAMEYDPHPPFDCGSPEKAGPELVGAFKDWFAPMVGQTGGTIQSSAERFKSSKN